MFSKLKPSGYLQLPRELYQSVNAEKVSNPRYVWFNQSLAKSLGLSLVARKEPAVLSCLAGNELPEGIHSLALAYAGHQFGVYVPQLGDGRAVMLGEIVDREKTVWDIQLKGSGKTRYSRQGDGRAPLAATLREAIISEAMAGLDIPTTRTLAVVGCDEVIMRDTGLVPAAVLTRVAKSHLRTGSFQYAAALSDSTSLQALVEYAMHRHFPEMAQKDCPYLSMFTEIIDRQARLVAQWMGVGFIHGVMNTDNMSIIGETIDFGPCAFMDEFSWAQVYSSIDFQGRYAYGNQANIAYWNCTQLAHAFECLFQNDDPVVIQRLYERLKTFPQRFQQYWLEILCAKFGFFQSGESEIALMQDFLSMLDKEGADFTNCFRTLSYAVSSEESRIEMENFLGEGDKSQHWINQWLAELERQPRTLNESQLLMERSNPAYIPRNHRVEQAIHNIVEHQDNSLMHRLMTVLRNPYKEQVGNEDFQQLPNASERVYQTFCGT